MKNFIFLIAFLSILFISCSEQEEVCQKEDFQISFPKEAHTFGQMVAENIRFAVEEMNKNEKVDFSSSEQVEILMKKYSQNFLQQKGIFQTKSENYDPIINELIDRMKSLTKTQRYVLDLISKAKQTSKSYKDFIQSLKEINKYVQKSVSPIEQERLLRTIAVIYYGAKEIQTLIQEGHIFNNSPIRLMITKSEPTGPTPGSLSTWCSSTLSTVWLTAAIEPSPIGELVATGVTIYVGSLLLYEFVVRCKATGSLSVDECIKIYEECRTFTPNRPCDKCLHYCRSNHKRDSTCN